jgi:hypothetical protein
MFAAENRIAMKSKKALVVLFLFSLLLAVSCADRPTKAMRKAERRMEQQANQARKDYDKAKSGHYKRQAPKTRKMIREDRRRARRLNRSLRRY